MCCCIWIRFLKAGWKCCHVVSKPVHEGVRVCVCYNTGPKSYPPPQIISDELWVLRCSSHDRQEMLKQLFIKSMKSSLYKMFKLVYTECGGVSMKHAFVQKCLENIDIKERLI